MDSNARWLWLLRHGKAADHAAGGGPDRQRPLVARGKRDAGALGRRLAAGQGVLGLEGVPVPELIVCSSAVRTRQTAELVNQGLDDRLAIEAYASLYGATTDTALRYVREIDDGLRSALLVGHNPTMYQLAWELVAPVDDSGEEADEFDATASDRATLRTHGFPTCALAVVRLQVTSWEEAAEGCGRLAGVFSPPY